MLSFLDDDDEDDDEPQVSSSSYSSTSRSACDEFAHADPVQLLHATEHSSRASYMCNPAMCLAAAFDDLKEFLWSRW